MAKGKKSKVDMSDPAIQEALTRQGPPRLKQRFDSEVGPNLSEKFPECANPMARPKLEKIVINVNMGRHLDGIKLPPNVRETVVNTLTTISGQKPVVIKAKKSVANFKVREGSETSAMVTLRRERMWDFLDRFINLAVPRFKDFRGLPREAFDHAGSYSMGFKEQGVFPEVDMTSTNFSHGMNINFVFSKSSPDKSLAVLEGLGFPFYRLDDAEVAASMKKKKKGKRR
ncbi:MAG: 50S ribosomal protein L5 [Phycisphaerales bacterium]